MPALIFVGTLTFVSALACYWLKGGEAFQDAAVANLALLFDVLPRIAAALVILGLMQVLLPHDLVSRYLGRGSGIQGLVLATVLGAITFGGPMTSFPIVAALAIAGADAGAVIAFVTGWSLLGVSRAVVWEVPILGSEFVVLRTLASLPVPVIVGLLARKLDTVRPVPIKGVDPR